MIANITKSTNSIQQSNYQIIKTSLLKQATAPFIMQYIPILLSQGYHTNVSFKVLLPRFN